MNRTCLAATTAVLAAIGTLAVEHMIFQPAPAAAQQEPAQQDEPAGQDEEAPAQQDQPEDEEEEAPTEEEPTQIQVTDETLEAMESALAEVASVQATLEREGLYQPAVETLNSFAVTVGGSRAVDDLEAGRGVDPETFAALYAGFATPEVAEHLTTDEQGRLLYKGQLVMMYPRSRLTQLFRDRSALAERAAAAQ